MDKTHPAGHPVVTADVVIFTIQDGEIRLLLVRRGDEPDKGKWALPGGLVRMDEDLEHTAMRSLEAQTGVTGVFLEQLYTFGNAARDPRGRVITVAYYALVPSEKLQLKAASGAEAVGWFALDQVHSLAFDHEEIVRTARERLVAKLEYSTVAFQFMPEQFTLSELQRVYETIRQESLDKRNFRKWVLSQGWLEETGCLRRSGSHRPARLFRVKNPYTVEIIRHGRARGIKDDVGHSPGAETQTGFAPVTPGR